MDFYTKLFTSTLAFLIITLIIVGYYMSIAKNNQTYPPSVADCPDYYTLDVLGDCVVADMFTSFILDESCKRQNFSSAQYKVQGNGFDSGSCAKKLWANKCKVSWDGVSNNDLICYS